MVDLGGKKSSKERNKSTGTSQKEFKSWLRINDIRKEKKIGQIWVQCENSWSFSEHTRTGDLDIKWRWWGVNIEIPYTHRKST